MVLYAIFVVISVISLVIPVISVISDNRRTRLFVRLFNIKTEERKYCLVLRFYGQRQGEILCPSSFKQFIN